MAEDVILSKAKDLQSVRVNYPIERERPKGANHTTRAAGASARMASPS
jgi:hypothetical protein